MFSAVILLKTKTKLIVPKSWCENLESADVINFGTIRDKSRKIFYSPDKKKPADFNTPVNEQFDEKSDRCYIGFIFRTFGKYIYYDC